ncbi:hypothetical protein M407DRAFT_86131, partial [Tulasnella calospora MUT 4182]
MGSLQAPSPVAIAFACVVALGVTRLLRMGRREPDLPPGPPTRPVVGNLLDIPLSKPHLAFTELKAYGDICSLKIGYGTVVILNSIEAVHHVLVTCNAATASRPDLYVLNYITGGYFLPFMKNDLNWRVMRKAVLETMNSKVVDQHKPVQAVESAQLMNDLLVDPKNHFDHCRRYASSVVCAIVFGRRMPRANSYAAVTLHENSQVLDDLVKPGSTPPVDLIPILHYVPERWAKWKTLIRTQKERHRVFYDWLLSTVETRIAEGRGNGCLIETLLSKREQLGITREMIMYLGESLLEPGEDSTKNYMHNFLRIMVNHKAEQEKAQEEIDRVVGRDRMPSADDIANLPYVQAIVREVIRFRPFAPLGLPHKATEDVAYRGYRIPSNAVLLLNVWCIFHDETLFDQPEIFRPQRFLESPTGIKEGLEAKAYPLLNDIVFGAGRRVCPAMHLARNSLV